jgi:uncharacterized protein (DUF427 family)
MKAIWKDTIIAQSENTIIVENNHYFPPDSVRHEYLRPSQRHSVCPWKGTASYYDVVVAGDANDDAAWYYPEPKEAAQGIRGYVAFWNGVSVKP